MRKSNTARAVEPASDLRQRAARARDAAGRFIRRPDPPPPPAADEVDAELLQLGAQLGGAIARAKALHEASQQLIIADMPAFSAEGLRSKLRAAGHYEDEHDSDYPGGRLLNSLLRDAERETPTPAIASHPDAALVALGAEFMAAWAAEDAVDDNEAEYLACTGLAEQIARLPAATVAGLGIKALVLARLDSEDSGPRRPISAQGPLASHWNVLRQIQEGAARLAAGQAASATPSASVKPDLSALSVVELARLYPVLVRAEVALGSAGESPCFLQNNRTERTNAGRIINWEVDRLQRFSSAVAAEISRRQPDDRGDQAERANTLLTHMVLTGGVEEHPEVLSEICATWGSIR